MILITRNALKPLLLLSVCVCVWSIEIAYGHLWLVIT